MVKGVNKTVIEVMNTENKYFERILFIVNSDALELGEKKLKREAQNILNKYELTKDYATPLRHLYKQRKERATKMVIIGCSALIVAILVTVGVIL